jgi:hypothetical protein
MPTFVGMTMQWRPVGHAQGRLVVRRETDKE